MQQRRTILTAVAAVVSLALVGGACASAADTGEVSAASGRYGASLETSTTVPSLDGAAGGSSGPGGKRAQATENLLNALAENPALLDDLENLTPDQLEELTGLESEELGTLGITPATVGALGGVIDQIGSENDSGDEELSPETVSLLAAGGGALLTSTGGLTAAAAAVLSDLNIDPATFAVLIATALTVPAEVTSQLGELLQIVDPNGLGQFSGDTAALSVIAVLVGAILGRDPVALGQLVNAGDINPRFRGLIAWVANLATTLSPEFVDRINNITRVIGPWGIRALGAAIALIERPAVGAVFEQAFSDQLTVANAFGAALLFIPGLPQLVAPETFNDPYAIYSAVIGVSAIALLNADAPGFREFLEVIGVELPPEFRDGTR